MFRKMLIGSDVTVVDSSVSTLIRRSGRIIDETRNMLKIECNGQKCISIPKSSSVFELQIGAEKIVVSGKQIIGTPQERIHKL